jgi:nucleoid DNA-binding protein
MGSQTAAELLAERLGIDIGTAQRRLDDFSGALLSELLSGRRLSVDGLGSFAVEHDQASREQVAGGTRLVPPRNRLAFDSTSTASGDLRRIAADRMGLAADDARSLSSALGQLFTRCRRDGIGFTLRGLGDFSAAAAAGRFLFTPSPAIDSLLNTAYEGLQAISLPGGAVPDTATPASPKKPMLVAAVALLLLGTGAWLVLHLPVSASSSSTADRAVPASAAPVPAGAVPQPDSSVLFKGRYTVIAATFSSSKAAGQERQRLSRLGLRTMIWPVWDDGRRFYRVVTGDFASYRAAADSLKGMPGSLYRNAEIKQAYKNVVIYAEQGL